MNDIERVKISYDKLVEAKKELKKVLESESVVLSVEERGWIDQAKDYTNMGIGYLSMFV